MEEQQKLWEMHIENENHEKILDYLIKSCDQSSNINYTLDFSHNHKKMNVIEIRSLKISYLYPYEKNIITSWGSLRFR